MSGNGEALDAELERHLVECARSCRACPDCWDVPCGGCTAGGVCDAICKCDRDDDYALIEELYLELGGEGGCA